MSSTALAHIRICDFSGQLAGAGATRTLAAFGAQVIRIEDPVQRGRWDILRGVPPFVDDRKGIDMGGAFNNHNVEKLGITINLRTERGRELVAPAGRDLRRRHRELRAGRARPARLPVRGAAGDPSRHRLRVELGLRAPRARTASYKSWGPIAQAVCGLTATSGLPDLPPAGWGYSFMDHHGGNFMAMAILAALLHRNRTGVGQWIDMSAVEAGITLDGPALLDFTVNGRPTRRDGMPDSNHSQFPAMAPHNIYATQGDDDWVAIACRDDADWRALARVVGEPWSADPRFATRDDRLAREGELDDLLDDVGSARATASTSPRRCRRSAFPLRSSRAPKTASSTTSRPRCGGCGPSCTTARWVTCASTAFPCTSPPPIGRSRAADRASASTTTSCSATCSG